MNKSTQNQSNSKIRRFYKEDSNWFIDVPESNLSKEELLIFEGGALMLEQIAQGRKEVFMKYSTEGFSGANLLELICETPVYGGGAKYCLGKYNGEEKHVIIWFSDNMKYFFVHFAKHLYFKEVSKEEFLNFELRLEEVFVEN